MTGFANLLAERRFFRLALIAGSALLGLPGLGSAILSFVAILKGWQTGLVDLSIALLVFMGLASLAGLPLTLVTAGVALSWGLALFLGVLTGRYRSLVLPVQVLLVIALLAALLFTLWVDDPVAFWQAYFQTVTTQMNELGLPASDPTVLAGLAPQMTGIAGAGAVMSAILTLVVGAWWAARVGATALAEMFLPLKLGYVVGLLAAVIGIAAVFPIGDLPANLLMILAAGFAAQGLAVIHWQARARAWPWTIFLPVYLPLILGPSVLAVGVFCLAAVGFVDNWYSLRRFGKDVI